MSITNTIDHTTPADGTVTTNNQNNDTTQNETVNKSLNDDLNIDEKNETKVDEFNEKDKLLEKARKMTLALIKNDADQLKIYEKIHENQQYCIDMQDKRLAMIEKAKESVERHIKRLEGELEKLDDMDPSLINQTSLSGSVSTPSVASTSFEAPPRKTASTAAFNRGWETPVAAASSVLKRATGTSQLKNVISMKKSQKRKIGDISAGDTATDERAYCICQSVSYGEMVACDGKACPYEWFHYDCVGLTEPPTGAWFCDFCKK